VITVTSGADKQTKMVRSGSSYLSQSELVATFGLAQKTKADSIEIKWPSGQTDELTSVDAGQTVTVQEGKGIVNSRPYGAPAKKPAPAKVAKLSAERH
jgi:enediyne biosynthesis protein E4